MQVEVEYSLNLTPERVALLLDAVKPIASFDKSVERRRLARGLEFSLTAIKRKMDERKFTNVRGV